MEQGIESRIRVTEKDTRSKFQDFSMKTFLSRYFDRLTGEARPGWVCGWSQASPCQELDWQGVRSFQPSEFYRDRSFLGKDNYFCCRILSFQEELLRISYHFLLHLKLSKKLCWQQWPAWNIGNEFHLQTVRASILAPNSKWGVIKCKTAWGGRIWITATTYQSHSVPASLSSVHAVELLAGKASSRNNFEPICNAFSLQGWRFSKAVYLFNQFLRMVISYLLLASK